MVSESLGMWCPDLGLCDDYPLELGEDSKGGKHDRAGGECVKELGFFISFYYYSCIRIWKH